MTKKKTAFLQCKQNASSQNINPVAYINSNTLESLGNENSELEEILV